jgi:hypothetical protein
METEMNDQWVIKEIRREIKTFLEANENEITAYQNFWNTAKPSAKGAVYSSECLLKKKKSEISNK